MYNRSIPKIQIKLKTIFTITQFFSMVTPQEILCKGDYLCQSVHFQLLSPMLHVAT
jgi:hypothetical protein